MLLAAVMIMSSLALFGCATSSPVKQSQSISDDAYAQIQKGNYKKAQEMLAEALKINHKNAFAWLNLGVAYQQQKKYDDARRCYLKVVDYAWDETAGNKKAHGRSLVRMARDNLESLPASMPEEQDKK
jgi:Tfp pilus assembly protein PilF